MIRWTNNLWRLWCVDTIILRLPSRSLQVRAVGVLAEDRGWGLFNTSTCRLWQRQFSSRFIVCCLIFAIYSSMSCSTRCRASGGLHTEMSSRPTIDFDATTGLAFTRSRSSSPWDVKLTVVSALGAPAVAVSVRGYPERENISALFNQANIDLPAPGGPRSAPVSVGDRFPTCTPRLILSIRS